MSDGISPGARCSVCKTVIKQQYRLSHFYHVYSQTSIVYPSETTEGTAAFACPHGGSYELSFTSVPTEQEVQNKLISLKSTYYEGMPYTDDNLYFTDNFIPNFSIGFFACKAFAAELSDAAFGNWPARYSFDFSNVRVGDIIRLMNNGHSVIVIEVSKDTVTIAEGNYQHAVHWGRKLKRSDAEKEWNYIVTRYPE